MLLLIDNYDSFVYNLARYFEELGCATKVVRNDAIDIGDIRQLDPKAIVISPGPCTPNEAGVSLELIRTFSETIPILGVCLGHQAIAAAFGGNIIRAPQPIHGRTSQIEHSESGIFSGIPSPLRVGRYHSLIIDEGTLPKELIVTARTDDMIPMAVKHQTFPLYGVQFHPESVLTQHGHALLANFARLAGIPTRPCEFSDWKEPEPEAVNSKHPILPW